MMWQLTALFQMARNITYPKERNTKLQWQPLKTANDILFYNYNDVYVSSLHVMNLLRLELPYFLFPRECLQYFQALIANFCYQLNTFVPAPSKFCKILDTSPISFCKVQVGNIIIFQMWNVIYI